MRYNFINYKFLFFNNTVDSCYVQCLYLKFFDTQNYNPQKTLIIVYFIKLHVSNFLNFFLFPSRFDITNLLYRAHVTQ